VNQKRSKSVICFGLIVWIGFCVSTSAQPVYSQNVVGYANLPYYTGYNLVASPFGQGDNSLDNLFQIDVPQGATFTEWDFVAQQYLPVSTYNISSGWSINYILSYGQGGLLNTPVNFTNTFAGTVWPGINLFDSSRPFFTPPLVTDTGSLLLSCYVPFNNATFYQVVGRDPQDGESVTMLDALSQTSTTTTFDNGTWDNGDPSLNIGQSAFFNLLPTPEPEVASLLGVGIVSLLAFRRKAKR